MENINLNKAMIEWQKAQIELIEYLQSQGQDVSKLLEKVNSNFEDTIELGRVLEEKMRKQEMLNNE